MGVRKNFKKTKEDGTEYRGGAHRVTRPAPLNRYIREKLSMLQNEFYVQLSESEIEHMQSLTSEDAVDVYACRLLIDKL